MLTKARNKTNTLSGEVKWPISICSFLLEEEDGVGCHKSQGFGCDVTRTTTTASWTQYSNHRPRIRAKKNDTAIKLINHGH